MNWKETAFLFTDGGFGYKIYGEEYELTPGRLAIMQRTGQLEDAELIARHKDFMTEEERESYNALISYDTEQRIWIKTDHSFMFLLKSNIYPFSHEEDIIFKAQDEWEDKAKYSMHDLPDVNRVEVIDETGRAYTNWDDANKVTYSLQDDERTVKIFISKEG